MRAVLPTLAAAQAAVSRKPCLRLMFSTGGDLSGRLLRLVHTEAPYRGTAEITLANSDRAVPADITGAWVEIGYGDITSAGPETAASPRLWVKRQDNLSSPRGLFTTLYLEDGWECLGEDPVNIGAGADLYYRYERTQTVYSILYNVLAGMGFALPPSPPSAYDGVIQTFKPYLEINAQPYEDRRELVARLLAMTKCCLRMKPNRVCELVYPQSGDAVGETYRSDAAPFFYELCDGHALLIPNIEHVEANEGADGRWADRIEGTAVDAAQAARYMSVPHYSQAGRITLQADADQRAGALLAESQRMAGGCAAVIRHDCRLELYDRVAFTDSRGQAPVTCPSDPLARITTLKHVFDRAKGIYRLSVHMGGLPARRLEYSEDTPAQHLGGHEVKA